MHGISLVRARLSFMCITILLFGAIKFSLDNLSQVHNGYLLVPVKV